MTARAMTGRSIWTIFGLTDWDRVGRALLPALPVAALHELL